MGNLGYKKKSMKRTFIEWLILLRHKPLYYTPPMDFMPELRMYKLKSNFVYGAF